MVLSVAKLIEYGLFLFGISRSVSCSMQTVEFSKERDLVTWHITHFQGGTAIRALFKVSINLKQFMSLHPSFALNHFWHLKWHRLVLKLTVAQF